MATYFALLAIAGAIVWVLERTHRRAFDSVPRAPFGADREADADLTRIRRELEVRRQEDPAGVATRPALLQHCSKRLP